MGAGKDGKLPASRTQPVLLGNPYGTAPWLLCHPGAQHGSRDAGRGTPGWPYPPIQSRELKTHLSGLLQMAFAFTEVSEIFCHGLQ